jgi:hypothetical protein
MPPSASIVLWYGQASIVVCFDVAHFDRDVFAAHAEDRADINNHFVDLAVLVENQILDAADAAVLRVIDSAAEHLASTDLVWLGASLGGRTGRFSAAYKVLTPAPPPSGLCIV